MPSSGQLGVSLQVFVLDDAPKYAAPSYVWSHGTHTTPLLCNGQGTVQATKNLQDVLSHLAFDQSSVFRRMSLVTNGSGLMRSASTSRA